MLWSRQVTQTKSVAITLNRQIGIPRQSVISNSVEIYNVEITFLTYIFPERKVFLDATVFLTFYTTFPL